MWQLTCQDPNFTGSSCVNQVWVFVERFPPPLTNEQGVSILALIVSVWGLAYCLKFLRRFFWSKS